jgi:Iap family predicted aminopeptidase
VSGVNINKVGTTDSASFAKAGIPAITIHAANQEFLKQIHSSRDQLKLIDSKQYHETYQLVCGYLAYLDFVLK